MRLKLSDICEGSYASRADGERLRQAIEAALQTAPSCEVDFEMIRVASISFLDEAVAVLALKGDEGGLAARVQPVNMTAADRKLLEDLIAKRDGQRILMPAARERT